LERVRDRGYARQPGLLERALVYREAELPVSLPPKFDADISRRKLVAKTELAR